ncbi:N-6 DNA methylase [Rhodobacter sp. KR11]|uniref:Eco57I restriction-modification methylase domain-containing protein n=1 Tax=Rhodobacter sp. KR11 TaxID=2974588 RepID=UPI00222138A0|nr:N-6 DNA methylase [Rhodobacter sp. KR11]MCW1919229.1 N-6 DNA methylase [Rhodobacter sp. KR11]
MARKPSSAIVWPSLTLEGNLIAPAMLAEITDPETASARAESYGLRKGLTIREEISLAFRIGQAHFDDFAKLSLPAPEATTRFLKGLLSEAFGFHDLTPAAFPLALTAGEGRVPLAVVPPSDALDKRSPWLSEDRPRSAAFAVQDQLNAHDEALWGLASNGHTLRLMRDNASLTRPAYVEADLRQIFTTEDIASFTALWLLIHRSRFGAAQTPAPDCALERWRDEGTRAGETARNRLAGQVEEALKLLGTGFLDANPQLRADVLSGKIPLTDWFNELLRLVYRLIFVMVAEDRDLLHAEATPQDARDLYLQGYSLTRLRKLATRRAAWDRHTDRYETTQIAFRALTRGEPRLGLTALGGLFSPLAEHHLRGAKLQNRAYLHALWKLSWLSDGNAMVPVNWRAMQTEELGSVYESLLELQPQLDGARLTFATEAAETRGNQRKTTGSYYTPDSLVQALLDTALNPVLDACFAKPDPEKALLDLRVIDPAVGSGHFLLAAARRIATRLARYRAGGTPSAADFRHALRDAARACLHGVDRNPMAVELTKVALWIETVDPGKPLGYFDAQIRCGDALLGVFDLNVLQLGIPDEAYAPLAGDDKPTAKYYAKANRDAKDGQGDLLGASRRLPATRPLATEYTGFRNLTEDTVEEVEAKSRRYAQLRADPTFHKYETACDLYVAAYLLPKTGGPPPSRGARLVPTSEDLWQALDNGAVWGPLLGQASIARTARAFHWPLEFPDVFANGGFDAVLGNPPWERIKLQEQEFFATRSPAIAGAANKAARETLIKALALAPEGSPDRALHAEFVTAKRIAEATSAFARTPEVEEFVGRDRKVTTRPVGGRFPLTGRGDVNTYALFAEHFARMTGPQGRAGVIVPTGIATDATTAPFFAHLVAKRRLARLVDFENRAGLFPAVDSRMKFSLLTLGQDEGTARFAFFLTDPAQLAEPERNFTLTPGAIARLNPNTKTAPVFRSRKDAELTAQIYEAAPVLIEESKGEAGNPWGFTYMTKMFDMADSSHLFRTATQLQAEGFAREGANWVRGWVREDHAPYEAPPLETWLPLFEAKMAHQFDHRWAGYDESGEMVEFDVLKKASPDFEPPPRYWIDAALRDARAESMGWRRKWLTGWRDIARATDERTLIASLVPDVAVNHKIRLFFLPAAPQVQAAFTACLNSLVVDYLARQKVSATTLAVFMMAQLPILPPSFYTPERLAFLTPRVLRLTYTSHALAPFARDLGYDGPPFAWDEANRANLRAELDAFFARAYGLARQDLAYILDPAEVMGPDYPSETFRVLKEKETRHHGEYRTQRLVLAAWDRMVSDGSFAKLEL